MLSSMKHTESLNTHFWKNIFGIITTTISVNDLWNIMTQYVYMPRLLNKDVLIDAIKEGIEAGTFGYAESYDAEQQTYQGISFSRNFTCLRYERTNR